MLDWLRRSICLLYICIVHRSSSGCSGMQDICARNWLREDLCWIALWYANIFGVGIYMKSICLLYICIVLDLAVGVVLCKASMLDWLGRSICLLYICIVLDLVVGVVVCKTSMLELTGGPSAFSIYMHCPRSSSGCSGMLGICAQLTGEGHMKCNGIQCIYAWLNWGSICLLYICIVLDLVVGVAVCKTSVLNWLGEALYIYVLGSSSECSSMNWLSVMVFNASMLDWLGVPSAFYIYALF